MHLGPRPERLLLGLFHFVDSHDRRVFDAESGRPAGTVQQAALKLNWDEPAVVCLDLDLYSDEVAGHISRLSEPGVTVGSTD